jgi:hypothetical protein
MGGTGATPGLAGSAGQNPPPPSVDPVPPTADGPVLVDGQTAPPGGPPGSPDAIPSDDASSIINGRPPDAPPPVAIQRVSCPSDQGSLRLCLRFEDNLRDESSRSLTVSGDQLSFAAGSPDGGRAARLDPDTSIRVPDADDLDLITFTIEAWIKLDQLPTGSGRVAVVDKDGRFGMFVLPNGVLACSARGALASTEGGMIPAGQWVAVACTSTSDSVVSWVAGTRRAEASAPSNMLGPLMEGMAIGSNMPSGDPLIGLLDNVRIWNRVLPADDICESALGCL